MVWLLDPNRLLPLLVGFWCITGLVQAVRRWPALATRRVAMDVGFAALGALAVTVLAVVAAPRHAAWLAMGAWMTFVVGPTLVARWATRQASRRRFRTAEGMAAALTVVRPLGNWGEVRQFFRALRWLSEGNQNAGLGMLRQLEQASRELSDEARAERQAIEGHWDQLVDTYRARRGVIPQSFLPRLLRALGETHQTQRLVATATRHADTVFGNPQLLPQVLLVVFAFCGRVELVRELFRRSLGYVDHTSRQAWLATAELASDHAERGRQRLMEAKGSADAQQLIAITRRLDDPPSPVNEVLTTTENHLVDELSSRWLRTARHVPGHGPNTIPWATALIVLLLAVFFGFEEALGGSMNPATLERVGALVPERVAEGEWWRVVSALFVHMGWLHLLMNGAALIALGTFIERRLGPLRTVALFVGSGSLPMLTHVVIAAFGEAVPSVGASGGVMGLAGAMTALLAQGVYERGVREAERHLRLVAILVVMQTGIDLMVPIVDFLGHAMGFATGFILGAIFVGLRWWRTAAIGVPAMAFALGMESLLGQLPWRVPPCSEGETVLCEQLCELGAQDACVRMGFKYAAGEDVEEDPQRARELLEPACQARVGDACAWLGALDYESKNQAKRTSGINLVVTGCELHSEWACDQLAEMCEQGEPQACSKLVEPPSASK